MPWRCSATSATVATIEKAMTAMPMPLCETGCGAKKRGTASMTRKMAEPVMKAAWPIAASGSALPCPKRCPRSDRKSVGTGKSVAVRVDLGGRRIHKKKKKEEQHRGTDE